MTHRRLISGVAAIGAALALAIPGVATAHSGAAGYVYTETNASTGNAILAYARSDDGVLSWLGTYPTHGLGTGAGLGTQGEVILAGGGKWLLAVNAGSNDISMFRVASDGRLTLTDRAGAQGMDPVSLTAHGSFVYVLDAGGSGNIAGFWASGGKLHRIADSVRPLSGSATSPAEVAFSTNAPPTCSTPTPSTRWGASAGPRPPLRRARSRMASPSTFGTIRSSPRRQTARSPRTGSARQALR